MARSICIEVAGALYHVMARGNRRESIYRDDDDRRFFLKTLAQACEKTGWRVHAWVLMGNNYHLLIQTPELQNTYTRRFNIRTGSGAASSATDTRPCRWKMKATTTRSCWITSI